MEEAKLYYVLNGLDSYSRKELNAFWDGYDYKNPSILSIGLSCTFRCNYKCRYCYAGTKKIPFDNELSTHEQLDLVSQAKALGAKTAVLCGDGDPLVDPNLVPIAEHCADMGITLVVVTNAAVLGDERLCEKYHGINCRSLSKKLSSAGISLIIKLDSVDPAKYNEIVGVRDGWDHLCRALEHLKTVGMFNKNSTNGVIVTRVAFSGVVMKDTLDEVPKMKNFSDKIGAQFICKLPTLTGCALTYLDFMFSAEDYDEIRSQIGEYTAKRETLMADTPRCIAWHYGPVVDITGEVRECYTSSCQNGRIGNIREQPLSTLMQRRNKLYDISTKDFCPVKTRINNELLHSRKGKLWQVLPENQSELRKSY
jgi:MoaA/NifB/PqqE/SkfB family radical SAM enzyme